MKLRIPSVAKFWINKFLHWKFRILGSGRPFDCLPDSPMQLHSVLDHEQVGLYLLCIKSFLRYFSSVAVVAHSNGTLTSADEELLKRQIKGIKVLPLLPTEYLKPVLGERAYRLCLSHTAYRKITDILLRPDNRLKRIIMLDADMLFLKSPDELIGWLKSEEDVLLFPLEYPADSVSELTDIDGMNRERNTLVRHGFNSGLLCFSRPFSPEELKIAFQLAESYARIPLEKRDFMTEQTINAILFQMRPSRALDPEEYRVFWDNLRDKEPKMLHFCSPYRFRAGVYDRLRKRVLREIA